MRATPVDQGTPRAEGPPLRILLTGIDGSGKSTAACRLTRAITESGGAAVMLRTPAGRRTMNGWWAALSWTPHPRVLDVLETALRVINVLLNEARLRRFEGVAVLDRGLQCQLALREARGLPRGILLPWLQRVLPAPDVVAHFDLPVDVALARIRARGTDRESHQDLTALVSGYRRLPEYATFMLIDADRPAEDVLGDLLALTGWGGRSHLPDDTLARH